MGKARRAYRGLEGQPYLRAERCRGSQRLVDDRDQYRRHLFTKPGVSPYDEVEWEKRDALIADSKGNPIFEQKDVEVPKDWSMTATNIVATCSPSPESLPTTRSNGKSATRLSRTRRATLSSSRKMSRFPKIGR